MAKQPQQTQFTLNNGIFVDLSYVRTRAMNKCRWIGRSFDGFDWKSSVDDAMADEQFMRWNNGVVVAYLCKQIQTRGLECALDWSIEKKQKRG